MSEMVERVSRALAREAFRRLERADPAVCARTYPQGEAAYVDEQWQLYSADARAAIEALRNPSEEMLVAIQDATVCVPGDVYMADAQGDYVWQCGIAAALGAPAEPKSGRLIKPARMPEGGTKAAIDAALEAK